MLNNAVQNNLPNNKAPSIEQSAQPTQMLGNLAQLQQDFDGFNSAIDSLLEELTQYNPPDPTILAADFQEMQTWLTQFSTDAQSQGWTSLVNVIQQFNTGSPSPMQQLDNDITSGNYTAAENDLYANGPSSIGFLNYEILAMLYPQPPSEIKK